MKRTLRKTLGLIMIIATLISINIPTYAGYGSGVLDVLGDKATPKEHQALTMSVNSVASISSLQAFCIGWNFTFSNSNGSVSVYIPLSQIDTDGGSRTYTFPMTTGWTKEFTGIKDAKSIRDLVSNKTTYDTIIKDGCTVHADARIQKYSCSPVPAPKGTFTPLNTYANSKNDIEYIDSNGIKRGNFTEFSDTFKTNTRSDYFDLSLTLAPEPVPLPTPKVNLTMPLDGSTVLQGTTVSFIGFGTGVHDIGGFVDGKFYEPEQLNPNEDITTQMKYETTVKLDILGPHTFYIVGRNAATGGSTDTSATHTLTVVAPDPTKGNIYIKCIDYDTNSIISSSSIPNVPYSIPKDVPSPSLDGYDYKGSYQTFATTTPDKSKMTAATSQTLTLTSTNKDAYVYFWYKAKPVVVVPDCQVIATLYDTTVRAGEYLYLSGDIYDTAGHTIANYFWTASGADEKEYNGNSAKLLYMTPGIYDLKLNVVCIAANVASATAKVTVTEPTPSASINVTGKKKENRKITLDGLGSSTPDKFPMVWTKTTWKIEPITATGAKWEMGVRLSDGTIKIINQSTDQAFLKGQNKFDFQARYAGQYSATLSVTNSKNLTTTTTNIIPVIPDEAPIADLDGDTYVLRDQLNPLGSTYPKWAKFNIYDKSSSPDGDTIKTRIWGYRYNSDNDKDSTGNENFNDETTIYKSNSTESFTSGQRLMVDSANDLNVELLNYDVGAFALELTVEEDIPESETIKELLVDSDYRRGYKKEWC